MEVIPGIHSVPGTRVSRIYLIEDEELTLVDTGMPWSAGRVFKYIESIGRRPDELSRILMTHNHPDHTGSARNISRRSGAQIVAHRRDAAYRGGAYSISYMSRFKPPNVPLPFLRHTPVHRLLVESEVIPVSGGIRVIHTPGHTPGSVCYMLEREGLLFSGDTIFSDHGRVSRSMPFPGSDMAQYRQSLKRLADMRFDILCGGHGSPLIGDASKMLRVLLEKKPQLPTWSEFIFKRMPARLLRRKRFSAED